MTFSFWILAGLLVVASLALLLWPLLRQPRGGAVVAQTALLREQLDALKAAHAAGLIDASSFATRQQALSAAALALIDAPASATARRKPSALITAVVLLLFIPAATAYLYGRIGTPNGIGFKGPAPAAQGAASSDEVAASSAPDLAKAADTLAEKLKENPNDGEGWALLARTYRAIERFDLANEAYGKARALLPEEADLLAESAEAMGLSSSPRVLAGEPEKLVDRALELNPGNQNALFLKGLARAQADDPNGAEAIWEKLLGLMDAGPAQAAVIEQLNIVRSKLGKPAMDTPSASPAPAMPAASPPSGDANVAGIEVSVSLAPELAANAQAGDVLFVFARAESGPPAPLAIQRLTVASLPVTLRLDESMGMITGMSLAQFPRVVIGARISKSGNAQGQPGDLETLSAPLEWRTAGKLNLIIDRVRP